jgi:hypothetical protein
MQEPARGDAHPRGARPSGAPDFQRYFADRQNLANRLFPGPSNQMTRTTAERIQGLLRQPAGEPPAKRRQEGTSLTVATPEDIAQVREALEQQNELLRAILASTVDTQTDARSTAQNSRTFAWAGTAIALLTLIATVISVVAAVRAG